VHLVAALQPKSSSSLSPSLLEGISPWQVPMTWRPSPHANRLFWLACLGVTFALWTGRAAFAGFAIPGLLALGATREKRANVVRINTRLSTAQVLEGEPLGLRVTMEAAETDVDLTFLPSRGVQTLAATSQDGTSLERNFVLYTEHWGRESPGVVEVRFDSRFHHFEGHGSIKLPEVVCYPLPVANIHAAALGKLASRSGDHSAQVSGDGVEFFGVRQYAAGDRQRSINWSATTRHGSLQVNTFRAERSQDVVIVVDASGSVGDLGSSTLDRSLRGALGVAQAHLKARDRVGAVFFGADLVWLTPGLGNRQLARLMAATLEIKPGWLADQGVAVLPRAAIPPGASVVAFSPMLEPSFSETLRDLRERGLPVVLVDVLDIGASPRGPRPSRMARRLWAVERQAMIYALGGLGVPVVRWSDAAPLQLPVPQWRGLSPGARV
jgi:uncharacterized protein (DUF58 family)